MATGSEGNKSFQELQIVDEAESEFIDSTIERIARENAFGRGKLVSITGKIDNCDKGKHFMSKVEFKTVKIVDEDGNQKEVPLVIKIQVADIKHMAEHARKMFSNEISMFNQVLPLLGVKDIELFPRLFFCELGKSVSSDIIIMEDMTIQKFHLLEQTVTEKNRMAFLLRKLGQFHGACYRAKNRDPSVIDYLKTVLKPTKHFEHSGTPPPLHKNMSLKVAELLDQECDDLQRLMSNLRGSRDILVDMRTPVEPFAAVVHGDLFGSNILVRTSEDGQCITDACFIDLQTSSYSDPAFDLSFLIFMCASTELMEQHWDDFVADYWDGIISVEPRPGFNFEEMKNNVERKALSGFMDACFFIPLTMTPKNDLPGPAPPPGPGSSHNPDLMSESFLKKTPKEALNKLVNILKFAINKGFVKKTLKAFDD